MNFDDKTFVVGIGAQKAGTSWLHAYLADRGDIYLPRKEIHFFDTRYGPDAERRRKRLLDASSIQSKANTLRDLKLMGDCNGYRAFFKSNVPDHIRVFGEITPSYSLIGAGGYNEIRELFRHVRIIFIMRDPVERFYSHAQMSRNRRLARGLPQNDMASMMRDPAYIERSRYEITISNLEQVFPESEILYLFYERLFRPETIRDLCNFLGIEYIPADFGRVVNSGGPRNEDWTSADREVRALFKSTYRFCKKKFGAKFPKEWHLRR
jgi:hypothetical protein